MAELLLELFSEEIPAGLQVWAAKELETRINAGLKKAGLKTGASRVFSTPRRLTLIIDDVPEKTPDIREQRKGPRVGAPDKAIEGFLRGAGVASIGDCITQKDKKGEFYVAVIEKDGQHTSKLIATLVAEAIYKFPWPKSMRWGDGNLRWIRPLRSILCLLDDDGLGESVMDGLRDMFGSSDEKLAKDDIVHMEVAGINSDNLTYGHRFMAPQEIWVENAKDYEAKLLAGKVMLSHQDRMASILKQAEKLAKAESLELVADQGLLSESAGLVEWPTVMMGGFSEDFLKVPPEVLTISMKKHQKCFSLSDPTTKKLTNKFILVSNLLAEDGGKAIISGNERVINARLSDAQFFWQQDKQTPLEMLNPKLDNITFHAKLGTQGQRVIRITALAGDIAPLVDAKEEEAKSAAMLCKTDLVTEMVGEFPDLQGLMGRYYAEACCHKPHIALAIQEHYLPQGPNDRVPESPISISVALADKFDILTGFWAIDEKPTGSKDPFALRRAALGIIRIILENDLRLDLHTLHSLARHYYGDTLPKSTDSAAISKEYHDLKNFFIDRLKVYLRDKGIKHDRIDAVFALPGQDDLQLIVQKVQAVDDFLKTDDGANLLAGVKRASNILRIEEKKDKETYNGPVKTYLIEDKQEETLYKMIKEVRSAVQDNMEKENFQAAMTAVAKLRKPVDEFFDHVMVNHEKKDIRRNRLQILNQIRTVTGDIADLGRIES